MCNSREHFSMVMFFKNYVMSIFLFHISFKFIEPMPEVTTRKSPPAVIQDDKYCHFVARFENSCVPGSSYGKEGVFFLRKQYYIK